ncbi:hypothetical protein [Ensifer soli]|uniref:hypothetical protein n=1 Tax=Ciceribacter sp. sgz301302 TaxID=3342379 RepID=UPI0035B8D3D3
MTQHSDPSDIDQTACREVISIETFCRKYRIEKAEEERLRLLFGRFATRAELLMNAQRSPVFR